MQCYYHLIKSLVPYMDGSTDLSTTVSSVGSLRVLESVSHTHTHTYIFISNTNV